MAWMWLNEPGEWHEDQGMISLVTEPQTDFWRKTHDGAVRDNGHFRFTPVEGNFVVDVAIRGMYQDLYDQAGLMLRLDAETWLKCGIEFVDGAQYASAVVTRDFSDWSVVPLPAPPPVFHLRLKRQGGNVEVYYSLDGERFWLLRQSFLTEAARVDIGIMGASPIGNGFRTVFEDLRIRTDATS
jgi:uncharacterized protein